MKYFLIYIDILGFEERGKVDAEKTGRPVEDIRDSYVDSIEGRLKELKKIGIISYSYENRKGDFHDDFLVSTDSIWKAFKSVDEVLKAKLPLEVAIGVEEFDHPYLIERSDKTISYLKTHVIAKYRKFYKKEHDGNSPEKTFILLTSEAYEQLDSKRMCSKPYPSAEFYLAEREGFERKLKILEFLEKIGSQRAGYREIEKLYVEPGNYDKIKSTLKEHNIAFIIGDAEIGKTYTAVRLLLEYSKEGYEPVYIPEERRGEQWEFIRRGMERRGKAVYLEDPWGSVEFERVESLFRDTGTFIAEVKREKCKIIITSREKVFKEFEKRRETAEDFLKYVTPFKVDSAYRKNDYLEMLERYIDVFVPAWGNDKKLRKIAFEAVGEKLRTPMSIKRLIDYTKDAMDENSLNAGIEKAAEDTKIAFAREIKELFNRGEYDSLVFLSFPYIGVRPEVAKSCYESVLTDLGYSLKARDFNDLIEEFNEVEVLHGLRYFHPSYSDAFGSALTDDGKPNNICKKIFSSVLLKLSENDKATLGVALAVAMNFDTLPENARNLLFKLAENDKAAEDVAWAVAMNFDTLPENARNLLFKLAENDNVAGDVAWPIAENFNKLPGDVRNLLFNLAEKDGAAGDVAWAIAVNFNTLPEDVRDLLFNLAEKDGAAGNVAWAIVWNVDMLPENVRNKLLFKLAEKDEAAGDVAWTVAKNFNTLPEDVRDLLSDRLQDQIQHIIKNLSYNDPLETIKLISTIRSKIDKDFALKILDRLSKYEDGEVRTKAETLMNTMREDVKE